jgi:hypothetical protein
MNPFSQACSVNQRLSKNTFLTMLDSQIDTSKVIVLSTGKVLNTNNINSSTIQNNINNGIWTYYEKSLPRRLFLTNPNWQIISFDSSSRNVCVKMTSPSQTIIFNITLLQPWVKY